jgi:hypothetical protein
VAGDHVRIADHDRSANRLYRRVKRSLQADFRADAGRISGCDGNSRSGL